MTPTAESLINVITFVLSSFLMKHIDVFPIVCGWNFSLFHKWVYPCCSAEPEAASSARGLKGGASATEENLPDRLTHFILSLILE